MPTPRESSSVMTGRRLSIETPEHVVIEFELAGLGSRAAALVLDLLLVIGLTFVVVITMALGQGFGGGAPWLTSIMILLIFLIPWGYFTLFEALAGGQTPGKRRMGIRVIMATGHSVTFAASAIRNLMRLVDAQPGAAFAVGLMFVLLHRHNKRLGDLVAGTVVVREKGDEFTLPEVEGQEVGEPEELIASEPLLTNEEYAFLERLLARVDDLETGRRIRLVRQAAERFRDRFPVRSTDPRAFLTDVYESESRSRRSRFAARRTADRGKTVRTAESFVTRRQSVWRTFRTLVDQTGTRGVGSLDGAEIVAFAGKYREVAADLARARTYGVDPRVMLVLERLVSAGHNILYQSGVAKRPKLWTVVMRDLPRALIVGRLYIVTAFVLFLVPGVIGFALLRGQPDVAGQVLPDGVIARAEAGASQQAAGRGYAEYPSPYLPLVASSIMANNLQVAFAAFAFGVTAGVGTVFVLLFNGLFFGAVVGHFANVGLAGWLLTFVAGHGVLELFAIFVAGGAGLVVAQAVVAPGDRSRREALVVQGRLAIRMVGAAVLLLVLAALIEGFVSASAAPSSLKFGVSAASAVLLILVLLAGYATQTGHDAVRPAGTVGGGAEG